MKPIHHPKFGLLAHSFFWLLAYPCFAQYATLGPTSCGLGQSNCHTTENNWWSADKHFRTNERFYDSAKSGEIAKAYGISLNNARLTGSKCMTCHGTVVTGREQRETEESVSCESCHGAGSGYKDNHSASPEKGMGNGYKTAIQFGMRRNKEMPVRAQMCVTCHAITDTKLLNAGHPNGKRFDYAKGLQTVAKHFRTPDTPQERTQFLAAVERAKSGVLVAVAPAIATSKPVVDLTPKPARTEMKPVLPKSATITDTSNVNPLLPTSKPQAVPRANPIFTPEPRFVAPALPLVPLTKPINQLEIPPFPDFKKCRTRADTLAALIRHVNALLKIESNN